MRLAWSMQKRIMLAGWLIAVCTSGLAAYFNFQYDSRRYAIDYTQEILEKRIAILSLLATSGLEVKAPPTMRDGLEQYSFALCASNGQVLWSAKLQPALEARWLCQQALLEQPENNLLTKETHSPEGMLYFLHVFASAFEGQSTYFVISRDGQEYVAWQKEKKLKLVISLAALMLTVGGLLWLSFGWLMQPLEQAEVELNAIRTGEQAEMASAYPVELRAVVAAINQLLQQTLASTERHKLVVDDLAHSLKTRLAALYAISQESASGSPPTEQQQATEELIQQMDQLVAYHLKRATVGQQGLSRQHTPVCPLVHKLATMLGKIHHHKPIAVHCSGHEQTVPMSEDDLLELLGNLLDNSYRFATARIEVKVLSRDGQTVLCVADDGPGIPFESQRQLLKRGKRADERHVGQGIGLAVCQNIAESYGATLLLETASLGGLLVKVTFANDD